MSERIETIVLDGESIRPPSAEADHERNIALTDLMHDNSFSLLEHPSGPYDVTLRVEESRLIMEVKGKARTEPHRIALATSSLKRTIRDYFLICESYYAALKEAKPHKLEAIDMGRRGVHNEGSEALQSMLEGKISMDFNTARRLFTLICVLHMK